MMLGIVLYGPPAAGKDTVTTALNTLDRRYQLYPRMKIGTGRTEGYRMTTEAEAHNYREAGEVLWEIHRYNSTYLIDRSHLNTMLQHCIPVVHIGQSQAIHAVTAAFPSATWLTVYLWSPRDTAATRISDRNTGDTNDRLQVWDATEALPDADLMIDTSQVTPPRAAHQIHHAVTHAQR